MRSELKKRLDEDLMQVVCDRDCPQAFQELYDRHAGPAYSLARVICADGADADEALQEGFLSIWRSRASYRRELGTFRNWALQVVRNRALDLIRRQAAASRPQINGGEFVEALSTGADSTYDAAVAAFHTNQVRASMLKLPREQAEAVWLAYFGGMSGSQIAAHLELPEGTVKGRIRLGLEKLRGELSPAFAQAEREGSSPSLRMKTSIA